MGELTGFPCRMSYLKFRWSSEVQKTLRDFREWNSGINPNDIENITFLKDAAAAAIYGSRAAEVSLS